MPVLPLSQLVHVEDILFRCWSVIARVLHMRVMLIPTMKEKQTKPGWLLHCRPTIACHNNLGTLWLITYHPTFHPRDSSGLPWRPCTSCSSPGTVPPQRGKGTTQTAPSCHPQGNGYPVGCQYSSPWSRRTTRPTN